MKQFEEGVKHRCTLHFVLITLGTPMQFSFLQRPLFSVDVSQCPVSSEWGGGLPFSALDTVCCVLIQHSAMRHSRRSSTTVHEGVWGKKN